MSNPFFENKGPFLILDILNFLETKTLSIKKNVEIKDIKDLYSSNNSEITFFHSKKYKELAQKTKASFCITTESLKNELPSSCVPLIVDNVLISVSKVTSLFYPDAVNDDFDISASNIDDTDLKYKVIYGKNVLIGKNVISELLELYKSFISFTSIFVSIDSFFKFKKFKISLIKKGPWFLKKGLDIIACNRAIKSWVINIYCYLFLIYNCS